MAYGWAYNHAMAAGDIQQKLKDGIAALRAGERERGRDLLLEVVEADPNIEPAWLWLATAVDDPADKIIALENALTLNPHNNRVRAELEKLKPPPPPETKPKSLWEPEETPAAPPPRESPVSAPRPAPPAPLNLNTAVDATEDPLQCPYCGKLTAEADRQCPHCKQSLLAAATWRGGLSLYLFWLIFGLSVQFAVIETLIPLGAGVLSTGTPHPWLVEFTESLKPFAGVPWGVLAMRAAIFLIALFIILAEVPYGFVITAGVLAADVLVNALALFRPSPFTQFAVLNLAFSGPLLLLVLSLLINQVWTKKRLFTEIERGLNDDGSLYKAAQRQLKQGQIALAALHLRQAMRLQPRETAYYKQLARVQAQLGRYTQARQTLELGATRAPRDPDFPKLLREVEKMGK